MLFAADRDATWWREFANERKPAGAETVEYLDERRGVYRVAHIADGRLAFSLFVGPAESEVGWDGVKQMLTRADAGSRSRMHLLSGSNAAGEAEAGPLVCACFGVGLRAIRTAI